MSEAPIYEIKNLWKSYSNGTSLVEVLKGVTLTVPRGESVAVRGPSGVGKSTLLHILGLLDRAAEGTVILDGRDVSDMSDQDRALVRNRRIGFVFQFFQLLPEFNALENVMMPGYIAGVDMDELQEQANERLAAVGLAHRALHRPGELSGGEQQRVAIARALIMNPDVILADEPTGNLDPTTGQEIDELLKTLNESLGTTLIVVTHKESLSRAMNRRIGLVAGKLVELQ